LGRPSLKQLERQCQKPDHRRVGNWMARRVTRPAALRVTWVIAPWGVSATAISLAAWASAVAAAVAFGWGTLASWLVGAVLLQLWYLLDHVDGQLARLRGCASLDGVQLDYLMHHTVNLLIPIGIGFGVFRAQGGPLWLVAGIGWGTALLLVTLQHDARYKAFCQRLKRLKGRLEVVGGGGARPEAQPPVPRGPFRLAGWVARKFTEMHVLMNLLGLVALVQWFTGDVDLFTGRVSAIVCASAAAAVAVWTVARSFARGDAETEFARWYRVPDGAELSFRDGWWHVLRCEDAKAEQAGGTRVVRRRQSS